MPKLETFQLRLPANLARRLRFIAAEEEVTPEAYLAGAAHDSMLALIRGPHVNDCDDEDRAAAVAVNPPNRSTR